MTKLLELQESIRATHAAIARIERGVSQHPGSFLLEAEAMSLRKRLSSLEAKFSAETAELGIDICAYRLFGRHESTPILALANALSRFQTMVTVVYDSIKLSIPKQRANVSAESRVESTLNFGYSYSGSLGMMLTIPNERLLFGESNLDLAISDIFELAHATRPEQIREFAQRLGPAPVRTMYQWAEGLIESGLGADIEWRRNLSVRAQLLIQEPELRELHHIISETSEETIEQIVIEGQLTGADVDRKTFHMKLESGEDIRGSFREAISISQTVELPKRYRAVLNKSETIRFSTEENLISYELLKLEPM